MAVELAGARTQGIAFIVSAGVVYEIIAAACSSPQTTEINADTRAETLMKWVYVGLAQSALLIGIAAWLDPAHRWAIIGGGAVAAALMWLSYQHARTAGLASTQPGTEY